MPLAIIPPEEQALLSGLIDRYTLNDLVAELADICRLRAQHTAIVLQDKWLAASWEAAGAALRAVELDKKL